MCKIRFKTTNLKITVCPDSSCSPEAEAYCPFPASNTIHRVLWFIVYITTATCLTHNHAMRPEK